MFWIFLSFIWWHGSTTLAMPTSDLETWKCPEIAQQPIVECSCDMPHTLRCTGDRTAMQIIGRTLRSLDVAYVSLLDCTVQNVTSLPGPLLEGVALHGLVVSSGEISDIHATAFQGLAAPLQALGLPNNQLTSVPTDALKSIPELDRLDLSGNKLKVLEGDSFKGLKNLSFIDLSDNVLTKLASKAFANLPQLKILRLRGNRLKLSAVMQMESLPTLEELDVSDNDLIGPLGVQTFPKMINLKDLQLSHNSLSSIKMGALKGVANLTSLSLHHNQIDVLEDNAFSSLTSLINLDLAHNRIVAVSGASLAHLVKLVDLDLRHNFLRALTADLIVPLKKLQNLRLDDNDISIVSSDALRHPTLLKRLTLLDNPLNCDCTLTDFAVWLANSSLTIEDKSSAVCTTPPPLENGLLIEIPLKELLCGEDEQEALIASHDVQMQQQQSQQAQTQTPVKAKINFQNFYYDGSQVSLQWNVEDTAIPYSCDAIFVYEEDGDSEILLETTPIKCNSSALDDPKLINVTVPNSENLQTGHRYRYCLVLLLSGSQTDELSLGLGCSDVIPLVQSINNNGKRKLIMDGNNKSDYSSKYPKVTGIQANLTNHGHLAIEVNLLIKSSGFLKTASPCEINVAILDQGSVLSQKHLNCSYPHYTFVGMEEGPYRVCANVIVKPGPLLEGMQKPRCITVFKRETHGFSGLDVAFVSIFLALSFMVIALIWGVRKVLLKPKIQTHQCFMPPEMEEQQQHNRYVKLQATTKL